MVRLTVSGLPNPKVGLNSRKYFKAKNKIFQKEKERLADLIIMSGERKDPLWERVSLEFTFISKDKIHRDVDNCIGNAKPWIDALQGLIVPDDYWRYIPKISGEYYVRDVEESYTEILITKM
jgi:hypothetical protein